MKLARRISIIGGATVVLMAGGLTGMGIAWAVVAPPPVPLSPTDTTYACVASNGVIKPSTMKLNVVPPTCPKATDFRPELER